MLGSREFSSDAPLQWACRFSRGVEESPTAAGASHKACRHLTSEELDLDGDLIFQCEDS